jgi:hypothetical protein
MKRELLKLEAGHSYRLKLIGNQWTPDAARINFSLLIGENKFPITKCLQYVVNLDDNKVYGTVFGLGLVLKMNKHKTDNPKKIMNSPTISFDVKSVVSPGGSKVLIDYQNFKMEASANFGRSRLDILKEFEDVQTQENYLTEYLDEIVEKSKRLKSYNLSDNPSHLPKTYIFNYD